MDTFISFLAAFSPILLALLGGVGWLYRKEIERRQNVEEQLSNRKYNTYHIIIDQFFATIMEAKSGKKQNEKRLVKELMKANKDLLIYASDSVLLAYQNFLAISRSDNYDFRNTAVAFAKLIVELRKDMVHPNTKMSEAHVLRQILNDFDEQIKQGGLLEGIITDVEQ